MQIVKKYTKGFMGGGQRKREEEKLFNQGYKIVSEEETKEWESGNACCLAILFLPLIFIKTKKIIVTYEK
jgi:hypothetical protein